MTRFASIMGVAAVATLVLLSGCETPTKTDYAKDLEGTWTNGPAQVMITNPQGATPPQIPAMRTVTAEITRTGMNKGSFTLTVSDALPAPAPAIETMASGTFEVDGKKITATIAQDGLTLPPGVTLTPAQTAALAGPQDFQYELTDNDMKLDLSSGVLVALTVTASPTAKFTLTKQMASGS